MQLKNINSYHTRDVVGDLEGDTLFRLSHVFDYEKCQFCLNKRHLYIETNAYIKLLELTNKL